MEQDVKPDSIVLKFERFRTIAEKLQIKYKEAATVIERLKEENNLSKDIEKNLRDQLFETQTRLIRFQENQKNFLDERNKKFEEATYLLEGKLADLEKQAIENQEKSKQLSEAAAKEIEFQKQIGQLNAALKEKEGDLEYMKKENKLMEDEKFHIITEYEEKITQLQDELKNSKKEYADLKVYCDRALQMYREQVKEYEKVIQDFEKERDDQIGEYTLPLQVFNKPQSALKGNKIQSKEDKRVTWADSTVSSFSEESSSKFDDNQLIDINSELCDELEKVEALMNNTKENNNLKPTFLPKVKKDVNKFVKTAGKQKPQLDFIVSTSEDNTIDNSCEKKTHFKRRRLYVDNGDFLM